MVAQVVAVSRDEAHRFSKVPCQTITLIAGLGVSGDAHAGTLVQHRSRVRRNPNQPNLRQVHLLQTELLHEVRAAGHDVTPGRMGENILTEGLDLLALPTDSRLRIGDAVLRVTGLRNPCHQINEYSDGLLSLVVGRVDGVDASDGGAIVRKAGVMAVVELGGDIRPTMDITVLSPPEPHRPLIPV